MTTSKESKRIDKVTIKRIADYDGDTSRLGEYSDTPGDYAIVAIGEWQGEFLNDLACECGLIESEHTDCSLNEDGDCNSEDHCCNFDRVEVSKGREYRYFNPPVENYKGSTDEEMRQYCQQDYQRMKGLNDGDWNFIGIKAYAEITIPINGDSRLCQEITSGGLWGIESDSEDSYLDEIGKEQLSELRDQLHALGFSKRAIAAAFRNVERESD